jgi:uncharacterized protein
MTRLLLATLAFYRRWLSPALHSLNPGGCRYLPTCSEYAAAAIATHGPLRGAALAAWRLLRCHPFARGGFDPVPRAAKQEDCFSSPPAAIQTSSADTFDARPFPRQPLP